MSDVTMPAVPRWRKHTLALRDQKHPREAYGPSGWTCPTCGPLEPIPPEWTETHEEATT